MAHPCAAFGAILDLIGVAFVPMRSPFASRSPLMLSTRLSGDGQPGLSPHPPAAAHVAESASNAGADDAAHQLEAARGLLREAAHLARYHNPSLQREIDAFLASLP